MNSINTFKYAKETGVALLIVGAFYLGIKANNISTAHRINQVTNEAIAGSNGNLNAYDSIVGINNYKCASDSIEQVLAKDAAAMQSQIGAFDTELFLTNKDKQNFSDTLNKQILEINERLANFKSENYK